MKIAVIQFPGSNCERETKMAVRQAGMEAYDFFWNDAPSSLSDFDGFVLVGGFSYEDRLRAGVFASLNIIMDALYEQGQCGKPILGICNGAQILLESGLVPGLPKRQLAAALVANKRVSNGTLLDGGYYNDWCYLKPSTTHYSKAFTNQFAENDVIKVPFAHAQGRFILNDTLRAMLKDNHGCCFYYCDALGQINDEFPTNPNGSVDNLAAISNKAGNILAMMPHPERVPEGRKIFDSMREFIRTRPVLDFKETFAIENQPSELSPYQMPKEQTNIFLELLIEDNTACSLALALKSQGLDVKVKRYQKWEVRTKADEITLMTDLTKTEALFNPNKEKVVDIKRDGNAQYYLVSDKDDMLARRKEAELKTRYNMAYVDGLKSSTVFAFETAACDREQLQTLLIDKHLLFNPYGQDCYVY